MNFYYCGGPVGGGHHYGPNPNGPNPNGVGQGYGAGTSKTPLPTPPGWRSRIKKALFVPVDARPEPEQ